MAGFLAALQMNKDKIWSTCNGEQYDDGRRVKLVERKEIDNNTIELSFEKPPKFQHQKGQYAILNLMEPKVTELDLPYRWLPVDSESQEPNLKFQIALADNSFSKSCKLLEILV